MSWSFVNRYQPARLFCAVMRRLGWDVMLYPDHFGHQAGDVEYDLRTKTTKLLYLADTIPNTALCRMHRRKCKIISVPTWLRVYFIEADIAYKCLSESLSRDLRFYNRKEIWQQTPSLEFSEDEKAYGDSVLQELGLEKGKYVCFHARDSRYGAMHHPDVLQKRLSKRMYMDLQMDESHPFQQHRNVDFSLYYSSIEWLKFVGLKAVRIGSDVERPYACQNLVDYASLRGTFDDPELADLYLMAHCRLYVGHASGVTHLSCVWNTPGVAVNWFPYHPGSTPTCNITACRVKRLKLGDETLSEFRSRHFFDLASWPQIYAVSSEIETVPTPPDVILDTVKGALGIRDAHAA